MNFAVAELERLKQFAELCFGGIPGLARALGKNKSIIYSYFSQKSAPGKKLLGQIEQIGGSGEWIRRGVGSMFADNEAGQALRLKFGNEEKKITEPRPDYLLGARSLDTQTIGRLIELVGISLQQHGKMLDDHEERITSLEHYVAAEKDSKTNGPVEETSEEQA